MTPKLKRLLRLELSGRYYHTGVVGKNHFKSQPCCALLLHKDSWLLLNSSPFSIQSNRILSIYFINRYKANNLAEKVGMLGLNFLLSHNQRIITLQWCINTPLLLFKKQASIRLWYTKTAQYIRCLITTLHLRLLPKGTPVKEEGVEPLSVITLQGNRMGILRVAVEKLTFVQQYLQLCIFYAWVSSL